MSAEEDYQRGYEAGLEDSSSSEDDEDAYDSGFEEGYDEGVRDGRQAGLYSGFEEAKALALKVISVYVQEYDPSMAISLEDIARVLSKRIEELEQ